MPSPTVPVSGSVLCCCVSAVPDGFFLTVSPVDFSAEFSSAEAPFYLALQLQPRIFAMCPVRPIPPIFPMLYDLAQVVEHLTEDEPMQETAAQRNARYAAAARLENLMHSSLQVIYVLDPDTLTDMPMLTDGNTLVGDVRARAAAHFGWDPNSFTLVYGCDPLTDDMDITSITEEETAIGCSLSFGIYRPNMAFINIEIRTVEHGTKHLRVKLTDSVCSLYRRLSLLTDWGVHNFTLRHENHTLDNMDLDLWTLGITIDTHMVMVGSLAGGTQRFHIGSPSSSPCAAAATGFDDSDISSIERDMETESSTSMPDMGRLAVAGSSALVLPMSSSMKQLSSSSPPSVRVGRCPPHQSSSPAASGSAGPGSSAAAPPWIPSSPPAGGILTLATQGMKRTYADAREAAPGWARTKVHP